LKIEEIRVFALRIPFKISARISSSEYRYCESMLVKLKAGDFLGYGEAVTDPAFTGETFESMLGAIRNYLGPAVLGLNPFALREIHTKMDQALVKNPAAKAAIDTACLDLVGKATGQAVHDLLGGDFNSEIFEVPEMILGPLDDCVKYCEEAVARGVRCLKVKVGEGVDEDVERVRRIREAVGDSVEIRLDANQGWRNYWTAVGIIKRIERYDVSMLEQPLPGHDLRACKMLRKAVDLPIMLDESVHGVNDALSAIALEACDLISVKTMKAGGLLRIKELVELCSAHGIPCHMGTSWETEIGWAANLGLIKGLPGIKLWDAYSPTEIYWGNSVSIGTPIQCHVEHGVPVVEVPEGPGLGITVDENAVTKHLIGEPISLRKSA
jgi:L-alanine-DL-glutamate epimerase-like enolase superfamily enzyme